MDTLKSKLSIVIFSILLAAVFNAKAQSFETMQKAFTASYTSEYKGNYTTAISDLQKGYNADNYECNLRMGWLYYKANQYEKALGYYQKAIDLKKYSVEARQGYILPANALKKYKEAYLKYEEILTIDPYNSTANYWVGVNYYNIKKYDIAAKYFELVVNMYPFDYDANHMLGWTNIYLGKKSDAKVLFQKALLYKPTDASAKSGLENCK